MEWACPQLRWVGLSTFVKVIKDYVPTYPPTQAGMSRGLSGGLDPVDNTNHH